MASPAGRSKTAGELDTLFTFLRHEQLPVGVEETLRLVHLLSVIEDVSRAAMEEVVACVVARSADERVACQRAVRLWVEVEKARLARELGAADGEPDPRERLDDEPDHEAVTDGPSPRGPSGPMRAPPPPMMRVAPPRLPRADKRILIAGGALAGVGLLVGSLAPGGAGGGSVLPGLATTLVGGVAAALALTVARRTQIARPSAVADREAALDRPPPPVVLSAPALLDGRAQDRLIEGVGSYATEHLTRSLDPARTIRATARLAGQPCLVFRPIHETRTVWLWIDDSARDGLVDRAVREVHQTLASSGIRAEVALFRGLPDPVGLCALPLTADGFGGGPYRLLPADEIDAQRSHGIVAVLTDGKELAMAMDGARAPEATRALAALSHFARLAVVDFSEGQTGLEALVHRHKLTVIRPEGLTAFLSGGVGGAAEALPRATMIEGPVMTWAAACALSPKAVDEATAHKLRARVAPGATPWSLGALMRLADAGGLVCFAPEARAKLVHWLWSSDVDGLREEGPFRSALQFWRERFKGNPVDEALLRLWDKPDAASAAADVLWDWSETPLGARIRLELGDRAPLPEEAGALRDPRGKLVLPWRLSELAPEARWRLRELGLGYVEKASAEERLRFPGTAALAIGWSAGIGVGALLSLTGSLVGALGGAAALAIAVYGVVRRFALLGVPGAAVEESESEPEVEAPEPEGAPPESKPEPEEVVAEPSETPDDVVHEAPPPSAPVLDQRASLLEMVEIRDGTFLMGSRDDDPRAYNSEKPQHQVEVGAFLLGKYAVTQEEYEAVTGSELIRHSGLREPVTHVSWLEAVRFCNLLSERERYEPAYEIEGEAVTWNEGADGYRLPTEAEWEYAARAGTQTAWSFGDDESMIRAYAWFRENSDGQPHPVGEKLPNRWGLFDMHGNVWEWCWDEFRSYSGASRSVGGRVLRGGSFLSVPRFLRSALRRWDLPGDRGRSFGFRCARGSRRPSRSVDR